MAASISTLQRVRYASGYVLLGMRREALEELEQIDPKERTTPLALEGWIDFHMATEQWAAAAAAARVLVEKLPLDPKGWISHAFAVRRLTGLSAAEEILLEAERHIGATCALVHYNLACYRCVAGDLEGAWLRLQTAFRMDPEWKKPALHDPDLERLRDRIAAEN
jgi:hypothetical protein